MQSDFNGNDHALKLALTLTIILLCQIDFEHHRECEISESSSDLTNSLRNQLNQQTLGPPFDWLTRAEFLYSRRYKCKPKSIKSVNDMSTAWKPIWTHIQKLPLLYQTSEETTFYFIGYYYVFHVQNNIQFYLTKLVEGYLHVY